MEISIISNGSVTTVIGELNLDACIDETHTFSSTITQFPIENGSNVSDHIFNSPDKLSIHGIVSDYPLPERINGNKADYQRVNGNVNYSIAQDTLDYLLKIRSDKKLVTVITLLKRYSQMAIKDIKIPRNAKIGGALELTIDFEQFTTAESESIPATALSGNQGISDQVAPKAERGKQSPELTKEQRKSLIMKLIDSLGVAK